MIRQAPKVEKERKGRPNMVITIVVITTCMKKHIDHMAQILHKNNLGDHIPEDDKKKLEDQAKQVKFHALIAINSSPDAWILYSGASHHITTKNNVLSSISACMGPPVLMRDDTPVEVIGQGRIKLPHEIFENVLHVPKLSMNLLSTYQITHYGK